MNPARPSRRRAGMTLIEALLAMLILGTSLAVFLVASSRCLGVARRSRNCQVARDLIARLELERPIDKEALDLISEDGDFEDGPPGFTWKRDIQPVGESDSGLFMITTRVAWSEAGREPYEEIIQLLYSEEAAKEAADSRRTAGGGSDRAVSDTGRGSEGVANRSSAARSSDSRSSSSRSSDSRSGSSRSSDSRSSGSSSRSTDSRRTR